MTGGRTAIVTGGDFSQVGLGKYSPFANPRASLQGAYLLGTKYDDSWLTDKSGVGHDLVAIGTPLVGAASSICSASGYFALPITDAQLAAANNEMTYVTVSKVPSTQAALLMSPGTNAPQSSMYVEATAGILGAISRDSSNTVTVDIAGSSTLAYVTVTAGGSGYSGDFPVAFGGSPTTAATGWAHVVGGVVVAIYVLTPGAGYGVAPSVDLSKGDGTGATATSFIGSTGPGDLGRGSRYEFSAATFSFTKTALYRRYGAMPTFQTVSATSPTLTALGSARPLHIGYGTDDSAGTYLAGTPEMVLGQAFNRALTLTELNQVYLSAQTFLASCGVTL